MAAVTHRNTKAEILAHCSELEAQLQDGPDWSQIATKIYNTANTAWRELSLLIRDVYDAGAATRRAVSFVIDELSRPVLR